MAVVLTATFEAEEAGAEDGAGDGEAADTWVAGAGGMIRLPRTPMPTLKVNRKIQAFECLRQKFYVNGYSCIYIYKKEDLWNSLYFGL